jgi:hypothetical protein
MECMRDHAAEVYRVETGKPFSPVREAGFQRAHASMIEARDYLASKARERREQFAPEGPVVAFSGGQVWEDVDLLWNGLDSIKARIPEMILATTAQAKGCDAVAHAWAASRGVKVIQFRLDRSQGNRAAFVRNDRILGLKPVKPSSAKAPASSRTSPRSCGRRGCRTSSASRTSAPSAARECSLGGAPASASLSIFFCGTCGAQGHRAPSRRGGALARSRNGHHSHRLRARQAARGRKGRVLRSAREDEMSIVFRITTSADHQERQTAVINARQLAAFREFLRGQGERLDMTLLDPDFAEDDSLLSVRGACLPAGARQHRTHLRLSDRCHHGAG